MNSVIVGKTLAATGGTLGFLLSLLLLRTVSGQLVLQDTVYLVSLTIGSLLGIAGTIIPRAGNRLQGAIILGGALLVMLGWTYAESNRSYYAAAVTFQTSVTIIFSWTAMIIAGGILVLSAWHRPREPKANGVQHSI